MKNDVYIKNTNIYEYNNSTFFNPALKYKEGLDLNIKSDEKIYREFRNLLIEMNLDKKILTAPNGIHLKILLKRETL